jgi:hypothetical protein
MVLGIFMIYGPRKTRRHALLMVCVVGIVTAMIGVIYVAGLYWSVVEKMDVLESGGGRAQTIATLVSAAAENSWIGVGRAIS